MCSGIPKELQRCWIAVVYNLFWPLHDDKTVNIEAALWAGSPDPLPHTCSPRCSQAVGGRNQRQVLVLAVGCKIAASIGVGILLTVDSAFSRQGVGGNRRNIHWYAGNCSMPLRRPIYVSQMSFLFAICKCY